MCCSIKWNYGVSSCVTPIIVKLKHLHYCQKQTDNHVPVTDKSERAVTCSWCSPFLSDTRCVELSIMCLLSSVLAVEMCGVLRVGALPVSEWSWLEEHSYIDCWMDKKYNVHNTPSTHLDKPSQGLLFAPTLSNKGETFSFRTEFQVKPTM